jgi:hypothetical protein
LSTIEQPSFISRIKIEENQFGYLSKNDNMKSIKFNIAIVLTIVLTAGNLHKTMGQSGTKERIFVSTDFISGGGSVNVISSDPAIIRFEPHNEGSGGWSQIWWSFKVGGLTPGEQIILQLDNEPAKSGISPQIYFSYDQKVWGQTNSGEHLEIEGEDFFVYKHIVHSKKVWFAYDLPYTPEHIEELLIPSADRDPGVEVFELCKTKNNRPVRALKFNDTENSEDNKYGIWLQARAHAFETGGSWVLHELAQWLLSGDPAAKALRKQAVITIVPIVDVDGVVEGRTGKNQTPNDHNRGWDKEPAFWPEVQTIKLMLTEMSKKNKVDLFIDFHGPGGLTHPYFIMARSQDLPFKEQRLNREKFLRVLKAKPLNVKEKLTQSMTQIHYNEKSDYMSKPEGLNASHWVTMNTNKHTVAVTLEVNMNTPLSTHYGYQAEAIVLGKAISNYFVNGLINKD